MMVYLQIANLGLNLMLIVVIFVLLKQRTKNSDIQHLILNQFFTKTWVNHRIHYWVKIQDIYVCYVDDGWYCSSDKPGTYYPPRPPFSPSPMPPPKKPPPEQP